MALKIYCVTTTINAKPEPTTSTRLIRAKSRLAATAHVAKDTIEVKLAEPDALIALTKAGVSVEDADNAD